jgi:serine/threonine-protein kinase
VIDHRTDLYAVGIFLYRLLTGRVPFTGTSARLLLEIVDRQPEPPSVHRRELTADVDRVVLTALAKDKEHRFRDAESMAEALRLTSLFAGYETP